MQTQRTKENSAQAEALKADSFGCEHENQIPLNSKPLRGMLGL
jgi:hypothetical protein